MQINDEIYCTDAKTKKAYKATVVGTAISESGYKLFMVLNSKGEKKSLEEAHCHYTEGEAVAFIEEKLQLIDVADQIIQEATHKVDKIRQQVIGFPLYEDLAKRIRGDK